MPSTFIKTETISGVEVYVHVDNRSGVFRITDKSDGGDLLASGDTLDQAIRKARPKLAAKKVKVSVPFVSLDGEPGQATGIHQKNRTVLVRLGGSADQLDFHRRVFREDIPADKVMRYVELTGQIRAAKAEQSEIEREYGLDLGRTVQAAIARAAEEAVGNDGA